MQVKKCRTTEFNDSDNDSESDDGRDIEWKPRNENRDTKTPTPRRRVRFVNEEERLTSTDASNEEMKDDEDAQKERSPSVRVDPLEELSVKSEVSSLGITENGPRR